MQQINMLYETPVMEIAVVEDNDIVTMSNEGIEGSGQTIDNIIWDGTW